MQLTTSTREMRCVRREKVARLRDNCEAYLFDLAVLRLGGQRFLRPGLPFELRPGELEALQKDGKSVVLLVEESEPGLLLKEIFVCSKQLTSERRLSKPSVGTIGQIINQDGELHTVLLKGETVVYKQQMPLPAFFTFCV